jgi:hypothetical protein
VRAVGLDEPQFEAILAAGCKSCGSTRLEISSYLDRQVSVMLADPNDDGVWTHDGLRFIGGAYRIACADCGAEPYTSADCPVCGRADMLASALATTSRLAVPKRCPACAHTELLVHAYAPSLTKTGGRTKPAPLAAFGEPGFHVFAIWCDSCDWKEGSTPCPLCGSVAR